MPRQFYRRGFFMYNKTIGIMSDEIQNIIQNRILQLGNPGISVQIAGPEAVSILEAIYQKGRDDSEREIRAAIAKQEAEEFITKAEAMELLGKSENTLWKWNRKGYLTWVKRGGTIMYARSSVLEILNGTKQQ